MFEEINRIFAQAESQYELRTLDPPELPPDAEELLTERGDLLDRIREIERRLEDEYGIEVA